MNRQPEGRHDAPNDNADRPGGDHGNVRPELHGIDGEREEAAAPDLGALKLQLRHDLYWREGDDDPLATGRP